MRTDQNLPAGARVATPRSRAGSRRHQIGGRLFALLMPLAAFGDERQDLITAGDEGYAMHRIRRSSPRRKARSLSRISPSELLGSSR